MGTPKPTRVLQMNGQYHGAYSQNLQGGKSRL